MSSRGQGLNSSFIGDTCSPPSSPPPPGSTLRPLQWQPAGSSFFLRASSVSPPQQGWLALKTRSQTRIQEAAGETRPDPGGPSGASCGDSQVRGCRPLPTWGKLGLLCHRQFHLPRPLAPCRVRSCHSPRVPPGLQGGCGAGAGPRGRGGAHQACRVGVSGQCGQRRPSAGLVQLVLFSVSCSLPPNPKSELVLEVEGPQSPQVSPALRGSARRSSPALAHQALEQPLQPCAVPQAAELAGERPVRVPWGPGEGMAGPRAVSVPGEGRGGGVRGAGLGRGRPAGSPGGRGERGRTPEQQRQQQQQRQGRDGHGGRAGGAERCCHRPSPAWPLYSPREPGGRAAPHRSTWKVRATHPAVAPAGRPPPSPRRRPLAGWGVGEESAAPGRGRAGPRGSGREAPGGGGTSRRACSGNSMCKASEPCLRALRGAVGPGWGDHRGAHLALGAGGGEPPKRAREELGEGGGRTGGRAPELEPRTPLERLDQRWE